MTPAALGRFAGLLALWAGVQLLERVAWRAGVTAAGSAAAAALTDLADDLADLEPFDVSDVVAAHPCVCCRTGAATPPEGLS